MIGSLNLPSNLNLPHKLQMQKKMLIEELKSFRLTKNENYKYFDFLKLQNQVFLNEPDNTPAIQQRTKRIWDAIEILGTENSFTSRIGGLYISNLVDTKDELLDSCIEFNFKWPKDQINDLNFILFRAGAVIVAEKSDLEHPIIHIRQEHVGEGKARHRRNFFFLRPGANLTVLESYESKMAESSLTTSATEIFMADNSSMDYCTLQDEGNGNLHFSQIRVHQKKDSKFNLNSINLGAALARQSVFIRHEGERAEADLCGLALTKSGQLLDQYIEVHHQVPHCKSRQFYKSIVSDSSKENFNGRVFVHSGAIGSDSSQVCRNLLLGKNSEANARPQLEIFNDDVKCSHGSTVGQLSAEELFYLESRGLSSEQAKKLLCRGFAEEIVNKIQNKKIQEVVEASVKSHFENLSYGKTK